MNDYIMYMQNIMQLYTVSYTLSINFKIIKFELNVCIHWSVILTLGFKLEFLIIGLV